MESLSMIHDAELSLKKVSVEELPIQNIKLFIFPPINLK